VTADAFEELFERHFDAVYGYLARRVGPELGRDLASETFTRALAGRKRFDPARGDAAAGCPTRNRASSASRR
jgi:DNA-directed RNA polymerase specialized sigma24 family protein